VRFSTFFSNLKLKNEKWTFINVLFSKIENRFEKTLHHHFFGVRLRHFCDLTFMLWWGRIALVIRRPLCSGLHIHDRGFKKWSRKLGSHFAQFLDGTFRGMFWIIPRAYFGEMEQNSSPQTDGAKDGRGSWDVILHNS
jgi:hypothetical protein